MRYILVIAVLFAATYSTLGQESSDSTVYQVVEQMPLFPGCDTVSGLEARMACSKNQLLQYIYDNVSYPDAARQQGIEGTAVVSFIVEKDGRMSNLEIIKNPGGGTGEEALRLMRSLRENNIRWTPGQLEGKAIRVQMNLPVRFKLEERKDYVLFGRDTIYTTNVESPQFKGGEAALAAYLKKHFDYPAIGLDSCRIGYMDLVILVRPNGETRVVDISNYSDLGFEFVYEAVYEAHEMWGRWQPGQYKNRNAGAVVKLRVWFTPPAATCSAVIADFEKAEQLATSASQDFNADRQAEGMKKINQAIDLFPDNAHYRYIRGQVYLQQQDFAAACSDYRYVRRVLNIPEVNQITQLVCGRAE